MLREQFIAAFADEWNERIAGETGKARILEAYPFDRAWTQYMLYGEQAFLAGVASRLRKHAGYERVRLSEQPVYTVDTVLYEHRPKGEPDLIGREYNGYPAKTYALIEHENGSAVEEEMWKLLWWRSPLKVIIFYDWARDERSRVPSRDTWLNNKILQLKQMRETVEGFHPEHPGTDYLLVVGDRDNEGATPRWRYAVLPETILTTFA